MIGAALRIGFGTASLLAGGWALRALQGTPSALGASPAEIDGVAKSSPNYRDGVFVNLDPASPISLTRQEQFLLVREVVGGSSASIPSEPVPLVAPDPSLAAADLAVTWYGHSSAVIEIDGYRVLADPVWSDRCSPSRAVGPAAAASGARPAGSAARDRCGASSATTITTTSTSTPSNSWRAPSGPSSSCHSALARTCGPGTSPPIGSSNSTGTRAPDSANSPWCAPRPGISPDGS